MRSNLLIASVSLIMSSCQDYDPEVDGSPVDPGGGEDHTLIFRDIDFTISPRVNSEAESMALWLSGQFIAPDSLYREALQALATVRAQYGASVPEVDSIHFSPPWVPGALGMILEPEGREALRHGKAEQLDSLNAWYHVVNVDTSWFSYDSNIVHIYFSGRLHADSLAEVYHHAREVDLVEPLFAAHFYECIFPVALQTGLGLLFQQGYGDCPLGCDYHQYWYFRIDGTTAQLVGNFRSSYDPTPEWWEEVAPAKALFCGSGRP